MRLAALVLITLIVGACGPRAEKGSTTAMSKSDPLASWNEGPSKAAITEFVARVTKEGGPDFVVPAERIAVFDNDGTLWSEQPIYFQFAYAVDRIKATASDHPEWKGKQPFAGILSGDFKAALAGGEPAIGELLVATHAGMTTDEFAKDIRDWLATAKHPKTGLPYTSMVYQPMLELLSYLRAHGFKTFIVSGGGVEFMRVWVEGVYGIPPEQVVGSTGDLRYDLGADQPTLMKLPKIDHVDDGAGKPVGIQRFIGRRPILAFGNSDGDLQMLQWTTLASGPRLGLIVHHTDGEREFAYDRQSHVGKLDRALDEAPRRGWILLDMKRDWKEIYPSVSVAH
ncbi:MAG: HAD family hydrolase [Candidatus Eiseniibacteriota bacterium]